MNHVLEFDKITFQYDEDVRPMFEQISFSVGQGEFVSVIGASGCGKSTLFRLINQLETAEEGKILVNGLDVREQKGYSGFMPQKDMLLPWRTVGQNLALPLEIRRIPKGQHKALVMQMLERVGLRECYDKYPRELSGGMRQRISFARTLLTGSDLLLLDEPFSALDVLTKLTMQEWLTEQWSELRKTVLFVTHDVEEALYLSTRILVLQDRPVTQVESIDIPMPYPRNRKMLEHPGILEMKDRLIERLQGKERDYDA